MATFQTRTDNVTIISKLRTEGRVETTVSSVETAAKRVESTANIGKTTADYR